MGRNLVLVGAAGLAFGFGAGKYHSYMDQPIGLSRNIENCPISYDPEIIVTDESILSQLGKIASKNEIRDGSNEFTDNVWADDPADKPGELACHYYRFPYGDVEQITVLLPPGESAVLSSGWPETKGKGQTLPDGLLHCEAPSPQALIDYPC